MTPEYALGHSVVMCLGVPVKLPYCPKPNAVLAPPNVIITIILKYLRFLLSYASSGDEMSNNRRKTWYAAITARSVPKRHNFSSRIVLPCHSNIITCSREYLGSFRRLSTVGILLPTLLCKVANLSRNDTCKQNRDAIDIV
jgi:hypothetical protein